MNKTWVVAKSEYLRRVKSRGFILTTLLLPVALTAFLGVIIWLGVSAYEETDARVIALVDETGVLEAPLQATADADELLFVVADGVSDDSLRQSVIDGTYSGYLVLPATLVDGEGTVSYYTAEGGGTMFQGQLDNLIEDAVEQERLRRRDVDPEVVRAIQANVPLRTVRLSEEGEEAGTTGLYIAFGFGMGFLIFMMMIVYGSVVMQGVIDEKLSRVVEVIVSSVKPFELMMGKVLGIGAMGLTQVIVWSGLILGGSFALGGIIALFIDPSKYDLAEGASTEELLAAADITLPAFPAELFVFFAIYFLGGYLLYASLYAAIGSIVESQQDAQGFLLPLLLPVIIAMYTLVPQVESPDSTLSIALSMIPLTSPISAIVRMAVTDVPWWQMLLSVGLLFATFFGVVWVTGRIYRVGILMYGKKPSLGELIRWIRYA